MAWIVSGTSPAGAMSEHAADEQRALERMYALSDDPRFDAFVFSCHPAEIGWRSCDASPLTRSCMSRRARCMTKRRCARTARVADMPGFPDQLLVHIDTPAAGELLTLLDGCPCSAGLRAFLRVLRGDVDAAEAQGPLFPRVEG